MARCPECNAKLVIPIDAAQWDRVYCAGCGAELEILNLSPLELEAIFEYDADDEALEELEQGDDNVWEDDDDDDEDDDEW